MRVHPPLCKPFAIAVPSSYICVYSVRCYTCVSNLYVICRDMTILASANAVDTAILGKSAQDKVRGSWCKN